MIEIEVPVWYSPGAGMTYRREYLPGSHPEHTYNYIKRVFNVDPGLYGVEKPPVKQPCNCQECSIDHY